MSPLGPFKAPKRPPTRRSHLERLVHSYARDNDVPQAHVRHLISSLALTGALQHVQDVDAELPVLRRMFAKRLRAYRSLGYELANETPAITVG